MKKLILLPFSLIVIFSGLYFLFPQVGTVVSTRMKFDRDKTPEAYFKCRERTVKNETAILSNENVELNIENWKKVVLPWADLKKEVDTAQGTLLAFKSGKGIQLFSSRESESGKEETAVEYSVSYEKLHEILDTTPDNISVFQTESEVNTKASNLILKTIYIAFGYPIFSCLWFFLRRLDYWLWN